MSKKLVISLMVGLLVVGCASSGNEKIRDHDQASLTQVIVPGKTTKAQIREYFGTPTSVTYTDGGNEIYKYAHARATVKPVTLIPIIGLFAGGNDVTTKTLTVLFDKNDVVTKFNMNDLQSETKTGVASQ